MNLVFDKYEIIRRLAIGGMGEVFLARQVGIGGFERLVIIKSLLQELAEQEGFIDQFLDEARVAATFNHQNIIQVYEVGKWNDVYFIAMEYIDGGNLSEIRRRGAKLNIRMPFFTALKIIHDAALGLDHAHKAVDVNGKPLGIVHRDVSPQNIMIRLDGITKVVDFGIAKAANRLSKTATGIIKGKFAYMSPEQLKNAELDARSDQFSLGIIIWEMCTGRKLFKGANEMETFENILHKPVPLIGSILPKAPAAIEKITAKMLQRDPNERYNDLLEMTEDLSAFLKSYGQGENIAEVADYVIKVKPDTFSTPDCTPSGSSDFLLSLGPFSNTGNVSESLPDDVGISRKSQNEAETGSEKNDSDLSGAPPLNRKAEDTKDSVPGFQAGDNYAGINQNRKKQIGLIALLSGFLAITAFFAYSFFTDTDSPPSEPVIIPWATDLEKVEKASIVYSVDAAKGSIKILEPDEAEIIFSDSLWHERIPTTITGISPGEYEILALLNDGTEIIESIKIPHPPPASAIINTEPEGASIKINGELMGTSPLRLDNLPADKKLSLDLSLAGYRSKSLDIIIPSGETRNMELRLQPQRTRPPSTKAGKQVPSHKSATASEDGYLTLNTTPWTLVTVDGISLGTTPIFRRSLRPGRHILLLENEQQGISTRHTVTISAGEHSRIDLNLAP